jgi:hypothetical protein
MSCPSRRRGGGVGFEGVPGSALRVTGIPNGGRPIATDLEDDSGASLMAASSRVLVVEDEPQVAVMLHAVITDLGNDVHRFRDASGATLQILRYRFSTMSVRSLPRMERSSAFSRARTPNLSRLAAKSSTTASKWASRIPKPTCEVFMSAPR